MSTPAEQAPAEEKKTNKGEDKKSNGKNAKQADAGNDAAMPKVAAAIKAAKEIKVIL